MDECRKDDRGQEFESTPIMTAVSLLLALSYLSWICAFSSAKPVRQTKASSVVHKQDLNETNVNWSRQLNETNTPERIALQTFSRLNWTTTTATSTTIFPSLWGTFTTLCNRLDLPFIDGTEIPAVKNAHAIITDIWHWYDRTIIYKTWDNNQCAGDPIYQ
eukprot:gene1838-4936_t